jgi:hypothetical protein
VTVPGRNALRQIFSENAPDHVLQHFVDCLRGGCSHEERGFLYAAINWNYRFLEHHAFPLVQERSLNLLEMAVHSSDINHHLPVKVHTPHDRLSLAYHIADNMMLEGRAFTRTDIRARIISVSVGEASGIRVNTLNEYVQENLSAFEDHLDHILEHRLNFDEIRELVAVHSSLRIGVL